MVTVSLCMIVKNEEEVLARCLDSVRDLADEIVIVDTPVPRTEPGRRRENTRTACSATRGTTISRRPEILRSRRGRGII